MSDSAWEIRNGFQSVWPDADLTNCFFHVSMNCDKKMKSKVHNEKDRKRLKSDIAMLQLSENEETFIKAAELFVKKWEGKYGEFTRYFHQQHVVTFGNWYEGKAFFSPSTNNALESRNGKVKQQWTNNKKLPLNEMMVVLEKMIHDWSMDNHVKPFATKPDLKDDDIIDGYIFAKKDIPALADPDEHEVTDSEGNAGYVWFICRDEKEKVTNRAIRNFKSLNWNTFDKFKQTNFELLKVCVLDDSVVTGTCTCRDFYKNFKCMHSLGLAIRMKKFIVARPLKLKAKEKIESTVPLPAKKRGPGRPKNATPALTR